MPKKNKWSFNSFVAPVGKPTPKKKTKKKSKKRSKKK